MTRRGPQRRSPLAARLLVLAMLSALLPGLASAQTTVVPATSARSDAELALANVAISALVTGVVALAEGRSFWTSAAKGGLGGLISFGGKTMIASDAHGLGFLGRSVSALGASVTRNAVMGTGVADTLVLPLGPLRLYLGTRDGLTSDLRVDLNSVAWAIYGLASDDFELDSGASWRTGTFVFYTPEEIETDGDRGTVARAGAGAVFLSEPYLPHAPRSIQHELTHVAEMDFLQIAFGGPGESALLRRAGMHDASILNRVDFGVGYYPFVAALRPMLEIEATSLERR